MSATTPRGYLTAAEKAEALSHSDPLLALQAFKWRDVEVPIARMRVSLAHDLVEHRYWGVDGARIEDTGLAPIRITASIPLINGLVGGVSEKFKSDLYTKTLRPLIVAFSRRERGLLQHPEFGPLICRAEHLDIEWDATKRSGAAAEASWVETNETDDSGVRLGEVAKSPASAMADAARSLDAADVDIRALVPKAPVYKESWEAAMNKVIGGVDQIGIQSKLYGGKIDQITYRAKMLGDSADRTRSALAWPIKHAAEVIKANADDLRKALAKLGRDIVIYQTLSESTLAGLYALLGSPAMSMTEMVRLNSALLREPAVPAGSLVRYFASPFA